MVGKARKLFDTAVYLSTEGPGRTILRQPARKDVFSQGGVADAVFYLQSGSAKLTVVSRRGKKATVTLLAAGDFFGEESMVETGMPRTGTVTAVSLCMVLRIEKDQMLRTVHDEHVFSDFFMQFILSRGIRTQADLVDQLFSSSEGRLARTLLLMADFGSSGEPAPLIPHITQETLAEMIGTTRSRVSFFMNRFRKHGYINYDGRIRVNASLLDVVLHDALPEGGASKPNLFDPPPRRARSAKRAQPALTA